MGLFSRDKPKIKVQTTKRDGFSGWVKCTSCHELVHTNELQKNYNCCPRCDTHYRLSAEDRIKLLADPDSFQELYGELTSQDFLNFVDTQSYAEKLEAECKKSGSNEALLAGVCTIEGQPLALAAMNFNFMGGSMGAVVGERLTRLIEEAREKRLPVVIVSCSGGARMQESIYSLMQMAKTSAALGRLKEAGLPFISVLTNPTTGGVTASFASLGDLIIAEPKALICFAGPRVIEQTIREKLPPDAQRSEFLLELGMIDAIVNRSDLRAALARYLYFMTGKRELQN